MGVLADTSLTTEEIDFLTSSVLSERIADGGKVQALDRIDSPSYNWFMSRAKSLGDPANGGYRFLVKANTNRRLQWWSGADILTFESKAQISDLIYEVGKAHMGNEIIYEMLERQGVRVTYGKGMNRSADPARKAGLNVTANFLKENFDDYDYNWSDEMRKAMWLSNAADAKAFSGFDALFPATGNSTGLIGKRDRGNPLFRHQLVTAITKTNFQTQFQAFIRNLERRAGGKKLNAVFVGDDFYDMLSDLFSGTDTVAGKFDFRAAQDKAMKMGEKMEIALPQECFVYRGILISIEPVFATLQAENPSTNPSWNKRLYAFAGDYCGFHPVIEDMEVAHAMPYNQRLERVSKHGEAVAWCNLPSATGVMVLN
jgi:hypothetical protein